jgi:ADP-ribose pyrophosphatase YjhB (NUDIX family)/nicotinamide mononucleotide adenylyltransferase
MNTNTVGVLVARFQTYKLTDGHTYLLNAVLTKHEKVLLFLGEAPTKGTRRNPLPFKVRKLMVLGSYPKDKFPNLEILDIGDVYNNKVWNANLDKKITAKIGETSAIVYGSRDSVCRTYKGKYKVVELAPSKSMSGTEFREATIAELLQDENFRRGWIAACYDRYPINYPTVDMVIFNAAGDEILLGRKVNDPDNKYRTPGGFFDRSVDKSLEEAAVREAMEETKLKGVGKPIYIGSTPIDDPRYAGEPDGILTSIFVIKDTIGEYEPSDDLDGLKWFKLKDLLEKDGEQFIDYHRPIWEKLKDYLSGTN